MRYALKSSASRHSLPPPCVSVCDVVGREDRAEPIMRQRQVNKSEEDEEENGVATSAAPPVPQDTAASPSLPASQQQHSEGNPGTPVQD
mmetsp:Transcript_3329/g.12052  ORF Transcript_3329/g.12052 Transcript_3329/m.12052 type:complete len:89 (+) Transcript_3329:1244-1510(+)